MNEKKNGSIRRLVPKKILTSTELKQLKLLNEEEHINELWRDRM